MSELDRIDVKDRFITLGGEKRKLLFGMKAFRYLQREFGTLKKAMDVLSSLSAKNLDLEILVTLTYAGLCIDKSVTKELVSDWVDELPSMTDAIDMIIVLAEAITDASPVSKKKN